MAVIQIAFDIPEAIKEGIDAGALLRFGGVVRDEAGRLVKYLEEVPIPKADSSVGENAIVKFAKKNKYFIIGVAIAAAGIICAIIKNRKGKEEAVPKCVVDFNVSFAEYVDSIKKGDVSEDKIDRVMADLEEIELNRENEHINITFSAESFSLLIGMVKDYTVKFAEANSVEVQEEDGNDYSRIAGLRHYLKIQKQIFEKCAWG